MRAAAGLAVLLAAGAGAWWWVRPVEPDPPAQPVAAAPPIPEAPPAGTGGAGLAVPSGQTVSHVETVVTDAGDGPVLRFRFLAPAIAREGGTVGGDVAQADMQVLCDGFALSNLPTDAPPAGRIVISLMDRPVPFGQAAPEATQFFEGYRVENGRCIWELF